MYHFFAGLDLGQVNDWTALCIMEEPVWVPEPPELLPFAMGRQLEETLYWQGIERYGWVPPSTLSTRQRQFFHARSYGGHRPDRPPLYVRHLERTRHRSYITIGDELKALLARPPISEMQVALLVDHTGVGRGVVDYLRHIGLPICAITITGGIEVHGSVLSDLTVPKRELIASCQIALQQGRLRIAPSLEHASTLTAELAGYQVKISQSGHDTYNAREGEHDDMVLAVSMACWYRDYISHYYDDAIARAQRPQEALR
jgi:hypothetical protein